MRDSAGPVGITGAEGVYKLGEMSKVVSFDGFPVWLNFSPGDISSARRHGRLGLWERMGASSSWVLTSKHFVKLPTEMYGRLLALQIP